MTPDSGHPAIFWDRDGTLMEERDYCGDPSKVRALPGAGAGLAALREAGWKNILITNQSGIGRGYFTMTDYEAVNAELFRQLGIPLDASYCCPDHPDAPTPRRKPGTGMVDEAVRDHHLNPQQSWFVGDKDIDVQCGRAAGCRTILVLTGYGARHGDGGADFVVADAAAAAALILNAPPS